MSSIPMVGLIVLIIIILIAIYVSSRLNVDFDNAATTEPYPEVNEAYIRASHLGNPSAPYNHKARAAKASYENTIRSWFATGHPSEPQQYNIIYTSGSTEGLNTVIKGLSNPIISSSIEHKSTLAAIEAVKSAGRQVIYVEPDQYGNTSISEMVAASSKFTAPLYILMAANNETGIMNNIAELVDRTETPRSDVVTSDSPLILVDITQTAGKFRPVMHPRVIYVTGFHKMHGPVGIGLIIHHKDVHIKPLIDGTQQNGMRGGTESLPLMAAAAAATAVAIRDEGRRIRKLNELSAHFRAELAKYFNVIAPEAMLATPLPDQYDPNLTQQSIVFAGTSGSALVSPVNPGIVAFSIINPGPLAKHFCNIKLQRSMSRKIGIGSACSKDKGSHVLRAMKLPYVLRCGFIRISFDDSQTKSDIDALIAELVKKSRAQVHNS